MDLSDCQGLAPATNSPDTTSFTFKCDVGSKEAVHHKVSSAEISSTKSPMNESSNDPVRTGVDLLPKAGSESPAASGLSPNPEVLGLGSKVDRNSQSEVPCFADSHPPSPSSDTPLPDSTTAHVSDLDSGTVTTSSLTPMSSRTVAVYPESMTCVLTHEVTQSVTETGLNMGPSSSATAEISVVHCDSSEQRSPDTSHICSPVQSSTTPNTGFLIDLDAQAER
ncbi:uncharacterized protein DEA37_0011581 [Paragonimus westermani]|uniref:Uncharacterized protein n=1 Tax=Paragonimus westermani TaxID=34504 RepID=A0A5J4NQQ9_9TREM|nr:uncharacterized protein DEA37_0011581 [Paragonimus westermani]